MEAFLIALWCVVLAVGMGLIVIGVRLRRSDEVRTGPPGNAVALVGVVLVSGAVGGLRQSLAHV